MGKASKLVGPDGKPLPTGDKPRTHPEATEQQRRHRRPAWKLIPVRQERTTDRHH